MVSLKLVNRAEFARMAGVSSAAVTKACKNALKPALLGKRIDLNHAAAKEYLERKEEGEILATGFDPLYEKAVKICRQLGRYSQRTVKANLKVGSERAKKIVGLMDATGVIPEPDEAPPVIKPPPPPKPEPEHKPEPPKPEPKKQRVIKGPTVSGHTAKTNTKKSASLANIDRAETPHEIPEDMATFADMTLRELINKFGSDYAFVDWLKAIKDIEGITEKRLKNAKTKGELVHRDLIKIGILEPIDEVFVNLLSDGARTLATRIPAKASSGESTIAMENYISEYMGKFIKKAKANVARVLKDVEA